MLLTRSRTGRKGPYACYYLHLEPGGKSFVGGGIWHAAAEPLALLRAAIDEHPTRWRRVLAGADFRSTFLPDAKWEKDGEAGVLREFAKRNQDGALKTKPKGWTADHVDIGLLKLRSF